MLAETLELFILDCVIILDACGTSITLKSEIRASTTIISIIVNPFKTSPFPVKKIMPQSVINVQFLKNMPINLLQILPDGVDFMLKTATLIILATAFSLNATLDLSKAQNSVEKTAVLHFNRSCELYFAGEIKEAFTEYLKAITADRKLLGVNEKGILDAAVKHFSQQLHVTPLDIEQRFLLARAYEAMGKINEAGIEYTKIIKNFPDTKFARMSWEQVNRYTFNKTLTQ